MSIFHYTNIKSLALILESKKIRFTRLDFLDDIKEIDGLPDYLKSRLFVSCWTEDEEENLSLWSLYTNMKGIRIEFPKKIFTEYIHPQGDYGNWGYAEDTICPLNIDELRTDEYLISNPFWLEDGFYTKVIYDEDYIELKKSAVISDEHKTIILHPKNLIQYKNLMWAFQKESRFYLMAQPLPPLSFFGGNKLEQMMNVALSFKSNMEIKHIDVNISPDVINNIIIRIHPNCDFADRLIIESLLEKYTEKGKLEISHLNEIYRSK